MCLEKHLLCHPVAWKLDPENNKKYKCKKLDLSRFTLDPVVKPRDDNNANYKKLNKENNKYV
ncbi:palindromic element RPE4 domain-containing protein [Rickettsia endosymbiont of Gonocerus acuteangulatus]|uniref:palindromic element RPE4 domain-containing protein n=1 Tax=Rickettsia endosymbiont of Gonocerus acuteangulatus TaxID=3066266 RepID=UPI0031329CAD